MGTFKELNDNSSDYNYLSSYATSKEQLKTAFKV